MRSTFSVIFYLKKDKVKKDGTSPIMGRITVDGTQAQFSCKLSIEPNLWGVKGGRAVGKSVTARETNRTLDKLRAAIHKALSGNHGARQFCHSRESQEYISWFGIPPTDTYKGL